MMPQRKISFLHRFRGRYSLRLHMTVILFATVGSGVLASKLLLIAHVDNFTFRYPLAVLLSYLVFFVCIKLWLLTMTPTQSGFGTRVVDAVDFPIGVSGSSSGSDATPFSGGEGEFSGAGASADFEVKAVAAPFVADALSDTSDGAGSDVGDAAGDALGGAGDAIGEAGGVVIVAIAALAIVVVAVFGVSAYLIYEAPVILSEVAFQGLLAATLTRSTREIALGDWVGSVFRATRKPFILTLAMAGLCGLFLHEFFPTATRLADIFR